jgi:DNA-binding IclR family transcriptional regulator
MSGELIGSLSVSGLIGRFTDERIHAARALLKDAADGLRARLPRLEQISLRKSNE